MQSVVRLYYCLKVRHTTTGKLFKSNWRRIGEKPSSLRTDHVVSMPLGDTSSSWVALLYPWFLHLFHNQHVLVTCMFWILMVCIWHILHDHPSWERSLLCGTIWGVFMPAFFHSVSPHALEHIQYSLFNQLFFAHHFLLWIVSLSFVTKCSSAFTSHSLTLSVWL